MKRSRNDDRPRRPGAGGPRRDDRKGPPRRDAAPGSRSSGRPRSAEDRPRREGDDRKPPYRKSPPRGRDEGPRRSGGDKPSYRKGPPRGRDERPQRAGGDKSFRKGPPRERSDRSDRPYNRPRQEERPAPARLQESRLRKTDKWNDAPKEEARGPRDAGRSDRPRYDGPPRSGRKTPYDRGPRERPYGDRSSDRPQRRYEPDEQRPFRRKGKAPVKKHADAPEDGLIRLNRFLAHGGVGSRREADQLISAGTVQVNGVTVTELGTKVKPGDVVHVGGQKVSMEQKRYILLNKPKDTITTTTDPRERHTVMALVANACPEQLHPVGRLDRNTTGLLLLTNDGDLTNTLTHPRHGVEKIYHATLDRNVSVDDLHRLTEGVRLDDGPAQADEVSYVGDSKNEVGMKLHIGRNRIVRRMFLVLGYEVVKLDRVFFAGLTKKDLPRGHWRHLTEQEVILLKRMK